MSGILLSWVSFARVSFLSKGHVACKVWKDQHIDRRAAPQQMQGRTHSDSAYYLEGGTATKWGWWTAQEANNSPGQDQWQSPPATAQIEVTSPITGLAWSLSSVVQEQSEQWPAVHHSPLLNSSAMPGLDFTTWGKMMDWRLSAIPEVDQTQNLTTPSAQV